MSVEQREIPRWNPQITRRQLLEGSLFVGGTVAVTTLSYVAYRALETFLCLMEGIRPNDGTLLSWLDESGKQRFGVVFGGKVYVDHGPDPITPHVYHPELARVITDEDYFEVFDMAGKKEWEHETPIRFTNIVGQQHIPLAEYQRLVDSVAIVNQDGKSLTGNSSSSQTAHAKALIAKEVSALNETGKPWTELSRVIGQGSRIVVNTAGSSYIGGEMINSAVENWVNQQYNTAK